MSRALQPLDLVRFALFGGAERRNRAYTSSACGVGQPPLWSSMDFVVPRLGRPGKSIAYVLTSGAQVDGLVAAQHRLGPQTWDITHLHLPASESNVASDLLARVSKAVTARGGERIVLRLRDDDRLEDEVRLAGFFPCYRETIYRARRPTIPAGPRPAMREVRPADDYLLFRLYCAAIPREVRSIFAMTFDQWRASRWGAPSRNVGYVYEEDGTVRGWVGIARHWRAGQISIMVHPDAELELSELVDFGLESLGERMSVYWAVPEYQVILRRLMIHRGYEPLLDLMTTVKKTAVVGREQARLPAAALSR